MSNLPPGVTQRMLDRHCDDGQTDQHRYEEELETTWDDLLDWFSDIKTNPDYLDRPAEVMRELLRTFPYLKKPMYFVSNPAPPRLEEPDDYDPTDRW